MEEVNNTIDTERERSGIIDAIIVKINNLTGMERAITARINGIATTFDMLEHNLTNLLTMVFTAWLNLRLRFLYNRLSCLDVCLSFVSFNTDWCSAIFLVQYHQSDNKEFPLYPINLPSISAISGTLTPKSQYGRQRLLL